MPAITPRPQSLRMLDRARETPQIDPRSHVPNGNDPVGTVGPEVAAVGGIGGWHAEAWAGWPGGWQTPWLESGTDDWSGFGYGRQDPNGYLGRVSTVSTCVDLNSSQLASFPVYGVDGNFTEDLPSWSINPQPGVYADWSDFMMAAANALYLDGEVFIWATDHFANTFPATFVAMPTAQMDIKLDEFGVLQYYHDGELLRRRDVLHIRYQVAAGHLHGISPLQWLGRHLVSASALERYATNIALHGVAALLKNPANLNAGQRNDAKNAWMTARAGNPAAPAVMSGGWEYEQLTLNPRDMALLDLKVFDEQHIAAGMRVPPFLVGIESPGGSMVYQNVSQLADHHWRVGLRTVAKKFATAMSLWALPGRRRMEFDRDEYIRPGFGERATAYATMHGIVDEEGNHAMEIPEIRVSERLLPKKDDNPSEVLTGANP